MPVTSTTTTPTTTTTTTTPMPTITKETVLIGTSDNNFVNVEYTANSASIVFLENLSSPIGAILCGTENNKVYVSAKDNLYIYTDNYYADSSDIKKILTTSNGDNSAISSYKFDNDSVWAVQSYEGKVVKMDPTTLTILETYAGFDAPFKIRWSAYHNLYFVAGSHILWKIDDVTKTAATVYEVNDYSIRDFDVSEKGEICFILDGNAEDIIRIVKSDLYTFLLNRKITGENPKFCKYCNKGRFYILAELNSGSSTYDAIHYVFDVSTSILNKVSSERALSTTTTTTTLGTTPDAVKISSPVGGEWIQLGKQYDIKWISSKSLGDFVKIELYKGGNFYSTVVNKTENTGIYGWNVPGNLDEESDYKIKITWLAASSGSANESITPGMFTLSLSVPTTTTTSTTTKAPEHAIGIDYTPVSDQIIIVLASGYYMLYQFEGSVVYGLINSGVLNPISIAAKGIQINGIDIQSAFRIFVGSAPYLSDKWDSGVITSELQSCYYGGGNNLTRGQKYFVNIQVCSRKFGWGETQSSSFTMPK